MKTTRDHGIHSTNVECHVLGRHGPSSCLQHGLSKALDFSAKHVAMWHCHNEERINPQNSWIFTWWWLFFYYLLSRTQISYSIHYLSPICWLICKSALFPESFLFLSPKVGLGSFSINSSKNITFKVNEHFWGRKDGAVVRILASQQCDQGSNPGFNTTCGLSLLLVLSLAPRGFSLDTPVFPSPQKTSTSKFQFDLECTDTFKWAHKSS